MNDIVATKMDITSIPGKDLVVIVDVRPNAVTRGILFQWGKRYVMTVQDSNIDWTAPDWVLSSGVVFPDETPALHCVQAFFGWATMAVFDPVAAQKQLDALMPYNTDEKPTIN